jgi:hypothetical protein
MVTPTQVVAGQTVQPYVDRPEVSETFADSLESCVHVNGVIRLEFVICRVDHPVPPAQPTVKKLTSARIVTTIPGLVGMIGHLNNVLAGLQAQGIVQVAPMPTPTDTMN